MSNFNNNLFKRLKLNHAYGQLIALIFVPIVILASVGSALVLTETSNAAKSGQRLAANAILSRYKYTAENLIILLEAFPERRDRAKNIFQNIYNEKYLISAAILDNDQKNFLSLGLNKEASWPKFPTQSPFFGPIPYNNNNVYGISLNTQTSEKNG